MGKPHKINVKRHSSKLRTYPDRVVKAAAQAVFDACPQVVPITRLVELFEDTLYRLCEAEKEGAKLKLQGKLTWTNSV